MVTLTPRAASLVESPPLAPSMGAARNTLTPPEQVAVTVASADAVTRQGSQAPLFANLAAVVTGSDLPAGLKQAVLAVLAQQTPLDTGLAGGDIESAFQKSGLFLEASLAAGATPSSGTMPDLKAALLVLRQALATIERAVPPTQGASPAPAAGGAAQAGSPSAARNSRKCRAAPIPPLPCSPTSPAGLRRRRRRGPCRLVLPQACCKRLRKACRA